MRVTRNRSGRVDEAAILRAARSGRALTCIGWWVVVATCGVSACANASTEGLERRPTLQQPSGSAGSGDDPPEAPPLDVESSSWCKARAVLAAKCQRCHGAEPENGAPFSLQTYEDTQVLSRKGAPRFEAIAAAVSSDFMPPTFIELEPPVQPLTASERGDLLAWCDSGAPNDADGDCPVP
jgi:hypothetical protein